MAEEVCELFNSCKFLLAFASDAENVKEAWALSFCNNRATSDKCKRKQYMLKNKIEPVSNMTPTGRML